MGQREMQIFFLFLLIFSPHNLTKKEPFFLKSLYFFLSLSLLIIRLQNLLEAEHQSTYPLNKYYISQIPQIRETYYLYNSSMYTSSSIFSPTKKTPIKMLSKQSFDESEEIDSYCEDFLQKTLPQQSSQKISNHLHSPKQYSSLHDKKPATHLYSSMPFSNQNKNPLNFLSTLNGEIFNRMKVLDNLKESYYTNQEKNFLKTFINIMDRMSNQLVEYKELYKNIDDEIEREEECVKLRERKNFFENQCLFLRQEYLKIQQERTEVKERSKNIKGQIKQLEADYKASKIKNLKYRRANSRAKSCQEALKTTRDIEDQSEIRCKRPTQFKTSGSSKRRANSQQGKYYNSIF